MINLHLDKPNESAWSPRKDNTVHTKNGNTKNIAISILKNTSMFLSLH
jgi:hypothetical protein